MPPQPYMVSQWWALSTCPNTSTSLFSQSPPKLVFLRCFMPSNDHIHIEPSNGCKKTTTPDFIRFSSKSDRVNKCSASGRRVRVTTATSNQAKSWRHPFNTSMPIRFTEACAIGPTNGGGPVGTIISTQRIVMTPTCPRCKACLLQNFCSDSSALAGKPPVAPPRATLHLPTPLFSPG